VRVGTFQGDRLDDLTGLYNQAQEGVPLAWRVTPAELRQAVFGPQRWGHGIYVEESPEEIILVTEDRALLGFVHAAPMPPELVPAEEATDAKAGYVRAIGFPPDRGDVGWRLITSAEEALRRQGCEIVRAFGGPGCSYRFSIGCAGGLSQRAIHVRVLMVEAGYQQTSSEALMEAPLHGAPSAPPVGPTVQVREMQRVQAGLTQSGCQLEASGKAVATCWWYPHAAIVSDPRAAGWAHLTEVDVDPASPGADDLRNVLLWAAELMRRQNLSHLSARVPMEHADLIELYRGAGMVQVDRCLSFVKDLRLQ